MAFLSMCVQNVQCGTLMAPVRTRPRDPTLTCTSILWLSSRIRSAAARTNCCCARPTSTTSCQQVRLWLWLWPWPYRTVLTLALTIQIIIMFSKAWQRCTNSCWLEKVPTLKGPQWSWNYSSPLHPTPDQASNPLIFLPRPNISKESLCQCY